MAAKSYKDREKSKSKTIIDVTHADSTPPSPNSKSVIVPTRPMLKDPMVVDKPGDADKLASQPAPEKDVLANAVTEPLASDAPAKAPSIAELAVTAAKEKAEKSSAQEDSEASSEEKPADSSPEKDQAETDKPDPAADQAAVQASQHDAKIGKLVESKQYFLPINTVEKRRSKRFVGLGILLSLLLLVA